METDQPDVFICTQLLGAPDIRAAAERRYAWRVGERLRIKFLSGSKKLHDRIEDTASEWLKYANIEFVFHAPAAAEIRINFDPDTGSWSYVGNACLRVHKSKPTMNLGWLTERSSDSEMRRVVLHEFGHALGLIHEHSSPVANIPWDEKAVFEYYKKTQGWSKSTTRDNVLTPEYSDIHTKFDPDSIMMYPIPGKLTGGKMNIPWFNSELSQLDKEFIGQLYPYSKPIQQTPKR